MGLFGFGKKKNNRAFAQARVTRNERCVLTEEAGPEIDAGLLIRGSRYRVITPITIPAGTYVIVTKTETIDNEKIAHVEPDYKATEDVRLQTESRLNESTDYTDPSIKAFLEGKFEERHVARQDSQQKSHEIVDLMQTKILKRNEKAKKRVAKTLEKGIKNPKVADIKPVTGATHQKVSNETANKDALTIQIEKEVAEQKLAEAKKAAAKAAAKKAPAKKPAAKTAAKKPAAKKAPAKKPAAKK